MLEVIIGMELGPTLAVSVWNEDMWAVTGVWVWVGRLPVECAGGVVEGGATVPDDMCEGTVVLAGICDVRGGFNLVVAALGERGVEGPFSTLEGLCAVVVEVSKTVSREFRSHTSSRDSASA